jgi:NADPH:quinone reductase
MLAVVADHPGAPDVLRPVVLPDPEPDAGQVRVATRFAAITFVDTQRRAGTSPGPPASFPVVLGNGVGGAVDAVGHDVDAAWIGTPVVTTTGGTEGYASLALADVGDLHRLPSGLSLEQATALLADGRTALGLYRAARIRADDTVAITAAAGGVGGLLVQLAAATGARVIGLASSHAKRDAARGLGAHAVVDYLQRDWPAQLRQAAPDGLDVAFDGVGGRKTTTLFSAMRPGGRFVSHGAASGALGETDDRAAADHGIALIGLGAIAPSAREQFQLTEKALELAAARRLRATIGQTWPLAEAAAAHAAIEARTTIGKTLLRA